jgi:serine/threonine protein kinase
MGQKCSKLCENISKKLSCSKNDENLEKNIKSNPKTPQSINIINENKKIENKEIFKIKTRNCKKTPIQIITNNNNNKIFDLNIQKSDAYFSPEDIIKINKILEEEKKMPTKKVKIRHYKVGNLIGQGSYGKVYEALDEEKGQLIAVKVIDKKRLNSLNNNSQSSISQFESEIEILSKLNHKNIVKYYGSNQSKNHLKIFFEYCEGGSIAKMLINYKSFPENIIRKYTKEMLEGLEYLHAHSIIHRDIKGANILVDRDGICKLSDFGGAKIIKEEMELSRNYSMKGTPNWMAPEIIKSGGATRFSDIWSIGCTIIEMFTGEPPYRDKSNPISILNCIAKNNEPPQIPEDMSDQLKDFVEKCLIIEPEKRYNVYQLKKHPFISDYISNESTINSLC